MIRAAFFANRQEDTNFLVIMVDDLDEFTFDQLLAAGLLPNIENHILNKGVRFTDSIVTNSACCPSRASFLTGQYAHNHGVNSTGGLHGGMAGFHPNGDMSRPTLAAWLQESPAESNLTAYFTALVGKYMNNYTAAENGIHLVPEGWDFWRVLNAPGTHQLEPGRYEIVDNQGLAQAPPVYQTRFIADTALELLSGTGQPWAQSEKEAFFLYVAPTAPHVISLPEDITHQGLCLASHPQWLERVVPDSAATSGYPPQAYELPAVPSCDRQYPEGCLRQDGPGGSIPLPGFDLPGVMRLGSEDAFLATYDQGEIGQMNEDVRPAWIDFHWDPLSCADNLALLRRQHLDRLESMLSVDLLVGDLVTALEAQRQLDNTLIIFTSDNGFMLGEQRLGNKQVAYEESIRVPLIIRPPHSTLTRGALNHQLVANIDLAPTILDYADRSWQDFPVDGRSLRPLLENAGSWLGLGRIFSGLTPWRDWLLIEHWHPDGEEDSLTHPDRWWRVPTHMAVRTAKDGSDLPPLTLVEYDDEAWGRNDPAWISYYGKEGYRASYLYDLSADPSQISNLSKDAAFADVLEELSAAKDRLMACAAASCRTADITP